LDDPDLLPMSSWDIAGWEDDGLFIFTPDPELARFVAKDSALARSILQDGNLSEAQGPWRYKSEIYNIGAKSVYPDGEGIEEDEEEEEECL
jgi:hypothetical protein